MFGVLGAGKGRWWKLALALVLFACGYAIANRYQLTHGVLYRWAANDTANALRNFALLAVQGAALLGAVWLLPRNWFVAGLALAVVSVIVNLGYGEIIDDRLGGAQVAWLMAESRQAGHAAGEFGGPLLFAFLQAIVAKVLIAGARWPLRRGLGVPRRGIALAGGLTLLLGPSLLSPWGLATGAERNLYTYAAEVATAEPPPPRGRVDLVPTVGGTPDHIVWLIDESVTHAMFARLVLPSTAPFGPIDFGEAVSMGNCSAPANVALRSGVDVRRAGPNMDLRKTPSIWGYAKKAGYRTVLVDGQATGAPQNLLLPPERALIDEYRAIAGGIDTDRTIAAWLNNRLKGPEKSFTYVMLRGVHFQYRDHFPPGRMPRNAPPIEQYRAALTYSKDRFFETLLDGLERSEVAVLYMSDHGQNLAPGALPHCSADPVAAEYMVPLLAFLPERLAQGFANPSPVRHSLSQVFPTTLEWMGYDAVAAQARYDTDLTSPPAAFVRFGRGVVPLRAGEPVEVIVSPRFP